MPLVLPGLLTRRITRSLWIYHTPLVVWYNVTYLRLYTTAHQAEKRSTIRSLALRLRGFVSISAEEGTTGLRLITRTNGM